MQLGSDFIDQIIDDHFFQCGYQAGVGPTRIFLNSSCEYSTFLVENAAQNHSQIHAKGASFLMFVGSDIFDSHRCL